MQRYMTRMVAQGFAQQYGTDFDETLCPVVRQESPQLLMTLSVKHGLSLHHVDVTTTFLNGTLDNEEYYIYSNQKALSVKERSSLYASLKVVCSEKMTWAYIVA